MKTSNLRNWVVIATVLLVGGAVLGIWLRYFRLPSNGVADHLEDVAVLRLGTYQPGQILEPGLPGFLRVDVTSPRAERFRELRAEGVRKESDVSIPEMQIGKPERPWWAGLRLIDKGRNSEQEVPAVVLEGRHPVLHLDRGETGYALIAIRPDVELTEGEHHLSALLDLSLQGVEDIRSEELPMVARRGSNAEGRGQALLSRYYRELGKTEDALRAARRVIEAEPGRAEGYVLKAEALEQMGQYRQARQAFVTAASHFPKDSYELPALYSAAIERLDAKIRQAAAR